MNTTPNPAPLEAPRMSAPRVLSFRYHAAHAGSAVQAALMAVARELNLPKAPASGCPADMAGIEVAVSEGVAPGAEGWSLGGCWYDVVVTVAPPAPPTDVLAEHARLRAEAAAVRSAARVEAALDQAEVEVAAAFTRLNNRLAQVASDALAAGAPLPEVEALLLGGAEALVAAYRAAS